MLKIVIDTNILVSALLKADSNPAIIMAMILDGRVILCLSPEIMAEYQGVLSRPKFKALKQAKVKLLLKTLKTKAVWVEAYEKVTLITNDPEDNKFLECVLAAKAEYLITGNSKHFPFKKFKHARVTSPAEFIADIAKIFLIP
jgi:uncharacterized protein